MPKIIFKAHKALWDDKEIRPEPARLSIPEWFKKLPTHYGNSKQDKTIKECMPFLDTLQTGYILKNPIDQEIHWLQHNSKENIDKDCWVQVNEELNHLHFFYNQFLNLNRGVETHPVKQLGETCPFVSMNSNRSFYKIMNPWTIELPDGYSVLFCPILNRPDLRFFPMSGIVDNGIGIPTNFPIVITKPGVWTLKKGEPIIACIPFKREEWQMECKIYEEKDLAKVRLSYGSKLFRWYRDKFWNKKKWK